MILGLSGRVAMDAWWRRSGGAGANGRLLRYESCAWYIAVALSDLRIKISRSLLPLSLLI